MSKTVYFEKQDHNLLISSLEWLWRNFCPIYHQHLKEMAFPLVFFFIAKFLAL